MHPFLLEEFTYFLGSSALSGLKKYSEPVGRIYPTQGTWPAARVLTFSLYRGS